MRFFDEDNKRFEWTMITLGFVLFAYYFSYYAIREIHTVRNERDGCPIAGCEEVKLPAGAFYYFYNPLIHIDRYSSPGVEFTFEPN